MKILFIENRYRTLFWRVAARHLREDGHTVKFIIQNKSFSDKGDRENEFIIQYPKEDANDTKDPRNLELIKSDRNLNYFNHRGTGHYDYYREKITEIISIYRPNVVFGESTAFHELISIDICKGLGIPYLHPSSSRYPVGRFAFYQYDTLKPFCGSREMLTNVECDNIINGITHRFIVPDYMKRTKISLPTKIRRLYELLHHSLAYLHGEHYNTPNPLVKFNIERRKKRIIGQWDKIATERKTWIDDNNNFYILYPMQMQPESNVDVWGRKCRNQLKTIKELLEFTDDDTRIIVKPNPKSKYELTQEFIDFINHTQRIIPVLHSESMQNVLSKTDMVLTVTGTIAIECVLSNMPVLTLVNTINNTNTNCIYIEDLSNTGQYIEMVKNGTFPKIDNNRKREFINLLNNTSYKGRTDESHVNDEENVASCMDAFRNVLESITK